MRILKLTKYLKKYKTQCTIGPLFKFFEAILELLMPMMLAQVIDKGIAAGDTDYIYTNLFILIGIITTGLICALICQYLASVASQGFGTVLRADLFKKIMAMSSSKTDKFGTQTLVNRITGDVNQLQNFVAMLIRLVIRAPFLCVGGIVMAFLMDYKFALIILLTLPVFGLCVIYKMKKSSPLYKNVYKRFDRLTSIVKENLAGLRIIRAFDKTKSEQKTYNDELNLYKNDLITVSKSVLMLNPLTILIMNGVIIAILLIAGIDLNSGGDMSAGTIIAMINYINIILNSMIVVSNLFVIFTKSFAAANRVMDLIECENEIVYGNGQSGNDDYIIVFDKVSFSYSNGENENQKTLSDISFKIKKGETVGITGMTGSGKTTLINLLQRKYDATGGNIYIDGRLISEYSRSALINKFSVVPQKIQLFKGTIAKNLKLGNESADSNTIEKAAKTAAAYDFIMQKENGFNSAVEKDGSNFSTGQKQRLAIARAITKPFDILILDDSSSALDYSTDFAIRKNISENFNDKTIIIISQKLNAIINADKIMVIDNGHIICEGKDEELYSTNAIYKTMSDIQQIKRGEKGYNKSP